MPYCRPGFGEAACAICHPLWPCCFVERGSRREVCPTVRGAREKCCGWRRLCLRRGFFFRLWTFCSVNRFPPGSIWVVRSFSVFTLVFFFFPRCGTRSLP